MKKISFVPYLPYSPTRYNINYLIPFPSYRMIFSPARLRVSKTSLTEKAKLRGTLHHNPIFTQILYANSHAENMWSVDSSSWPHKTHDRLST
ncbi:hypothetical protein HanXRQr2_Chr03g0137571 [Helianthus annuus]|uniref:Uncharacterized protein n=1 Tax=Helianthus annuus TaxID=4232 RepID=A0A9K3JKH2_HELAN|nr:hypothetical protein HanXRQr2_Chr03g0137571 [Helianthus annuus]